MESPYLYLKGLKDLASIVRGDEVIHIGIRPYGFHAGNAMALIAYPYLLCLNLEYIGKIPRFRFVISLNDWEQDALDGPDYRKYPFNIYPKNTSLQFTPDEEGCCASTTEHWEPRIRGSMVGIQARFLNTSFVFVRNSELKPHRCFKELLLRTLESPNEQAEIFKIYSGKEVLDTPVSYAGAVCPDCQRTRGVTSITNTGGVLWKCDRCGNTKIGDYTEFEYWWYHKPMFLARLEIFNVDISLSGGDHFSEGDFLIRRAFIERLSPHTKEPKMLFTPTVVVSNGEKMSKSRNNTAFADIGELIRAAARCQGSEMLFTDGIASANLDEKDYSRVF